MDVVIGDRWKPFLDTAVREGGYASQTDVVSEGLRLLEERERKLADLRATIDASIARGGSNTADEVIERIHTALDDRRDVRKRA